MLIILKQKKFIAILNKTKEIHDLNSSHVFYRTFILPYNTYCVDVWGKTYKTITNKIVLLQNRAIRIINRAVHPQTNQQIMPKFTGTQIL